MYPGIFQWIPDTNHDHLASKLVMVDTRCILPWWVIGGLSMHKLLTSAVHRYFIFFLYSFKFHLNICWTTIDGVVALSQLTARSCLTNMSDAFSEMFPTNTVVVGPALSSVSFTLMVPGSLFGVIGFCATAIVVGTSTCNIKLQLGIQVLLLSRSTIHARKQKWEYYKTLIINVRVS